MFDPTTGEQVGSVNPAGTPGYTAHDERGSVIANLNSTGQALFIDSYDEYGKPGSANNGRYGFTGQLWIPDGGLRLNYYKSRFYEPQLGRFLQPDPIGYADSPNVYDYVLGDPVNRADPFGMQACTNPKDDQKNKNSGTDSGGTSGGGGCEDNSQGEIIITGSRIRGPEVVVMGYWEQQFLLGNPIAYWGLHLGLNQNPPWAASYAKKTLLGAIAATPIDTANGKRYPTLQEIDDIYEQIRVALMLADIQARANDISGIPGLLSAFQVFQYHEQVFARFGLPATAFSAASVTGTWGEAYITSRGWCAGCDR